LFRVSKRTRTRRGRRKREIRKRKQKERKLRLFWYKGTGIHPLLVVLLFVTACFQWDCWFLCAVGFHPLPLAAHIYPSLLPFRVAYANAIVPNYFLLALTHFLRFFGVLVLAKNKTKNRHETIRRKQMGMWMVFCLFVVILFVSIFPLSGLLLTL